MLDPFERLESLYAELPSISCRCCGECCVSPTCTLVEFVHIMNHALKVLPHEEIARFLHARPTMHPGHEGNLVCSFVAESRCGVHPGRTGSCRFFGIPALEEFGVKDLTVCRNRVTVESGKADLSFLQNWIERLFALNREIYDFDAEPYFLRGINLEGWTDIYFDPSLDFEIFADIRDFMHRTLDMREFVDSYRQRTGIKDKVDKISLLSTLVGSGDRELLRRLVTSIRDDFPLTGTYYYEEANTYLRLLKDQNQFVGDA